jgi:AraC-like DNA-binding protein
MRLSHLMQHGDSPAFTAIPVTKTRAFTARNYQEPSFRFLWHYHPEWELTWTSSGTGQRYVGGSIEPFEPGDLVLLAGNLPHTWFSDPSSTQEARCSVIHFLPQLWGEEFWKLPEIQEVRRLFDSALRGVRFTGPRVAEVGKRIEELAVKEGPNLRSFVQVLEIFLLLLELPVVSLNASMDPSGLKPNPKLQQLLDWIEKRAAEDISQSEVAAQAKMSPAAFSRWFKSHMGCVFQRYLNELRVARACSLLVRSDMSVTDSAFQAGFNNLSNFNRRFQEITGLTPKAFRKQFRGHGDRDL